MVEPAWWGRVVEGVTQYRSEHPTNLTGATFAAETARDGRLTGAVGPGWDQRTICEIGSMTKTFIAATLLALLEEHDLLDVDRPVHTLPGMDLFAADPVKQRIAVRHLLQHTSGLPHFQHYSAWPATSCNDPTGGPPSCADPGLDLGPVSEWIGAPGLTNECVSTSQGCRPARTVDLDTVSAHIMRTYPVATTSPPGSAYTYSTVNYIVAARIIECIAGRSVNLVVKEKLLDPLQMVDSFFIAGESGDPLVDARLCEGTTAGQRARIAELTLITRHGGLPPEMASGPGGGWDRLRRGWRFVNPDGGMYSTTSDLLNFLVMLRDGGVFQGRRILSRPIVRLMMEDQGHGHTLGFGFRRQQTPYGQGPGTLEYLGYKMTYFWIDPSADDPLLGVFLSQRLPNITVNTNLNDGMQVIFRAFVPVVKAGAFGWPTPTSASA
jgi:CubicO group peptidase (beta-lactamase class C family)